MKVCELHGEVLPLLRELSPEQRAWALDAIRELLDDIRADLVLQEALGPDYEPLDPLTWQPSTPPPGVASAEC